MKNFKIYAITMVAVVIAIGSHTLMSFKNAEQNFDTNKDASAAELYWDFTGSENPTEADDPTNPLHYTLSELNQECYSGVEICQIKAPADLLADPSGNTPDFDAIVPFENVSLLDRIEEAMQNGPNETATLKN